MAGVLLDIDGVLTVSWKALPGATETLDWLRDQAIPFLLVTNTSSKSRSQIAGLLADAGMEVEPSAILTAVNSAAQFLSEQHPGVSCLVVNEGPLDEELPGVEIVDDDSAGIVLLGGAGPSLTYRDVDVVFNLALEGVPVVALHRNTRFQTVDGPALDMGAFIIGLEAAAGIEIPVLGKPAPEFFHAALTRLQTPPADTLMVGDDIVSDVFGAQAVGVSGVLVKTGKYRPSDLEDITDAPDHVLDDIRGLRRLLRQLSGDEAP